MIFHEAPRTPQLRARIERLQGATADELGWHLHRLQACGDDPQLAAIHQDVRATARCDLQVAPQDRIASGCAGRHRSAR